jgi:hypothetical protein|tara:strand:- start:968 stop:1171 length:204 start_codon:yes stop_codon:yes gene_type:complete
MEDEPLNAYDFPQCPVVISFEDGSCCVFQYAFYVLDNENFTVYSEHCGYHKFSKAGVMQIQGERKEM